MRTRVGLAIAWEVVDPGDTRGSVKGGGGAYFYVNDIDCSMFFFLFLVYVIVTW